jgi:hypothetical protein
MNQMRPGVKVRFWSPRYKNMPSVEPPGLLKLASILAIFSVVGVLIYAVALALSGTVGAVFKTSAAISVAVVHFVMPLGAIYTVATNSPLSRIVILAYSLVVYGTTVAGIGFLGGLQINFVTKFVVSTVVLVSVLSWLLGSLKMRVYYAVISGSELPDGLDRSADEILAPGAIECSLSRIGDKLGPIAEVVAGLLVIAGCAYAFLVTWGGL